MNMDSEEKNGDSKNLYSSPHIARNSRQGLMPEGRRERR